MEGVRWYMEVEVKLLLLNARLRCAPIRRLECPEWSDVSAKEPVLLGSP